MTPIALVLERITSATGRDPKRAGAGWASRCPAHDDHDPSLSISEGRDRNVLLKCHAGCDLDAIVASIGLAVTDLFPPKETSGTLGEVVASYIYTDADGTPMLRVNRFHPKTFRQQHAEGGAWVNGAGNTPKLLYRLPDVRAEAERGGTVWIAEGEKDVHALEAAGLVATCNAGGAGKFNSDHAAQLDGVGLAVVVVDNDATGRDHARKVGLELSLANIPYKLVMAAEGKDAADHLAAGHGVDEFVTVAHLGEEADDTDDQSEVEPGDDVHGWEPTDLSIVLASDYTPPRPTVLRRIDGAGLFYAGRVNALYGESGSGKSWIAMEAAAQILRAGGSVLYVDLEDHAGSVAARMIALGIDRATLIDRFVYISPLGAWNKIVSDWVVNCCLERTVELAVIDSTGEAMALDGAKPNDDDDTARWFRKVPRTIARTGAAVLLLDHVPKATDAPTGYAIGSQRKRAAIDGASYRVDVGVAPARGTPGHLKLVTAKDRGGTYQHGHKVADIDIVDTDGGTSVTIKPPNTGLPTVLMGRISDFLDTHGAASARQVETGVQGKGPTIRAALQIMVEKGYVERTPRTGKHGGFDHRLVRPFSELDQYEIGPESQPRPPRPNRVPEAGTHPTDLTASPRPPIHTNGGTGTRLESLEDTLEIASASPAEGRGQQTLAPTGTDNAPIFEVDDLY